MGHLTREQAHGDKKAAPFVALALLASGSRSAAYMVRIGGLKYVHYSDPAVSASTFRPD